MKTININGKDFTIEELSKLIEDSKNSVYPLYCRHLPTNKIVKFTDLTVGVVVKSGSDWRAYPIGLESECFIEQDTWQPIPVCPKTGFFHGQLVWAWDNSYTHSRLLFFYNTKIQKTFPITESYNSLSYENYAPFEGNWPDWALEAYKTLKL